MKKGESFFPPENAMSEETIFHEALARPTPEERAAFLDQACTGQPELRAAVEALLAAHERSGDLFATAAVPLPEPAATREHVSRDLAAGMVIGERYKLGEKIGEGGMGEVWVAKQEQPIKRKVALKLIKPG